MRCYQYDLYAICGLCLWLGLYLWGGATTFQPADSAEFLTVVATKGLAHPSGYPLFTMLGIGITSVLPVSVPRAMAILAALITWGTLLGIYLSLRQLTRNRMAAFFAAGIAGTSLHIWKHATHPEAFALLGFFAAWLSVFVVYALDPERSPKQRAFSWYGYALFVGLASSHHHSIVLTAPLGVLLLYRLFLSPKTKLPRPGPTMSLGVLLFVVGLLPNLYLFVGGQSNALGSWGSITTWSELWDHFLRKEFGTFQSGLYEVKRPWWFHSFAYLKKLASWKGTFPYGLFLSPIIGILMIALLRWPGKPKNEASTEQVATVKWQREIALTWLLCWLIAGLLFPTQLMMGTSHLDQYIVARFFVLPDVFAGLLAGIGLHVLYLRAHDLQQAYDDAAEKSTTTRRFLVPLLSFTIAYLLVMGASKQAPEANSRHKNWLERYARDLLREVPKGALLMEANDEATCFGVRYLQTVLKMRQDVRFVCIPMLARKWYVAQLKKAWPEFSYKWRPKHISSTALLKHYYKLGRAVHSTELYNRSMRMSFLWLPYGVTWQAWPHPKKAPPTPPQVEKRLLSNFLKLSSQHPLPHRTKDPWETFVVRRYANPWLSLAIIYRKMRRRKAVRRCRRRARLYIP